MEILAINKQKDKYQKTTFSIKTSQKDFTLEIIVISMLIVISGDYKIHVKPHFSIVFIRSWGNECRVTRHKIFI